MAKKTKDKPKVIGKTGTMKPFLYKKVYTNEVEKVEKGVYNFKTLLDGEVILEENNLKKKTMFLVGDYIRAKIDEYEVEEGIVTKEENPDEEEEEEEESNELEDMQKAVDEVKEEDEDEEWEEDDDEDEDEDDDNGDLELYIQFEEETGKKAVTTRGTLRKEFIKWKNDLEE